MVIRRLLLVLSVFACMVVGACSEVESPTEPIPLIPVPFDLGAVVGEGKITLSWQADPYFVFSGFAVYRSEGGSGVWSRIATTTAKSYIDTTVRTGVEYLYAVAGINASGVVGKVSTALEIFVAFFSVQIEDGAELTNTRDVSVRFNAPTGTQRVRFSEDSTFAGTAWRTFATLFPSVTLTAGDGPKVLFAQFTDPSGFETETFADSIRLDTQAAVQSASFTPSSPVPLGVTLHVIVRPVGAERDGRAEIEIDNLPGVFTAMDDGTNGDPTINDAVYERNYTVPSSQRGVDLVVSATFVDAAGNRSPAVEFPGRLTFTDPPAPVTLFPPLDSTTVSITLRWSLSSDAHFRRYELYRGETLPVSKDTAPRVASISSAGTAIFTDNSLREAETYYYVVYVVNDLDEYVASNVRTAYTADIPPTAVVLDAPSAVGPDRLTLTWSRNNNVDFQEYRVYRDTTPGVTTGSLRIGTISDRFQTFFDDSGLDTVNTKYYYRVYVFDRGGNSARSNEVSSP